MPKFVIVFLMKLLMRKLDAVHQRSDLQNSKIIS